MTTSRLDELIALAALGELSEDESRELDALLDADADAGAELAGALDAAAAVQGLHQTTAPPDLRDRVLAAIDAVDQEPAPSRSTGHDVAPVVSLVARRRRFAVALSAAAAAAALIVGGVLVVGRDTAGRPSIEAIVGSSDRVERPLVGELGDLRAVFSPDRGALAIVGSGVRPVAGDRTYEAWLVDASGATSIGLFRPDADGDVAVVIDDVDPSGFTIGITEEPAGGSEEPTLPILASA